MIQTLLSLSISLLLFCFLTPKKLLSQDAHNCLVNNNTPTYMNYDPGKELFQSDYRSLGQGNSKDKILMLELRTSFTTNGSDPYRLSVAKDGTWTATRLNKKDREVHHTRYITSMAFNDCERAFKIVTSVANLPANSKSKLLIIDNDFCNNNPNAILIVTKSNRIKSKNADHGVFYNKEIKKWLIYNQDKSAFELGETYHIVAFNDGEVIKTDDYIMTAGTHKLEIYKGVAKIDTNIIRNSYDVGVFIRFRSNEEIVYNKGFIGLSQAGLKKYRLTLTAEDAKKHPIANGTCINYVKVELNEEMLAAHKLKTDEFRNNEILRTQKMLAERKQAYEDKINAQKEKEEQWKKEAEEGNDPVLNFIDKVKTDTEAAKKREEETAERKQQSEEIKKQQEAQNSTSDKQKNDALKSYDSKSQPKTGSILAKPCSGVTQTIDFYWDPIEYAESYLITCKIMVNESNQWVTKTLFEKTVQSNSYKYQMKRDLDVANAGSLKYFVQANSGGKKYPEQPWEREIKLGECIGIPIITSPIPHSNASLENKWEGSSIWDFSWKSIKECYTYEIEIYSEKNEKRIVILAPRKVSQNREQNYLGDPLNFIYKTKDGEHFIDEHPELPARFDEWFVRVRGTRDNTKGPWSEPVKFQINPAKKPKPVGPAIGNIPISNLNLKTEMETVTIRHRALCFAQYVVSYDVFKNGKWQTDEKLIKFEPASNKSVLPNHVVEIPAEAINVEIIMHRVKVGGALGLKFHHIKLPKATATMHYDVLPSKDVGGLPEVFRTEPPLFPILVDKGDEKIQQFGQMIGETFLAVMNNIYNPERQAELIKEIENEELLGEAIAKYFDAAVALEIRNATKNSGINFKSISLSTCGGVSMIVEGNIDLGVAFPIGDAIDGSLNKDLKNIIFYASPSWSTGFSFGAEVGISLSLWTDAPRDIGGDAKGVVFSFPIGGEFSYTDKAGKPKSLGTGVSITTWFDNDQNFLGFSLTGSLGKSIGFGNQFVRAKTLIPAENN